MVVNNPHAIRIGDKVKNKHSKDKVKEMGHDVKYYDMIQNNNWRVTAFYPIYPYRMTV